MRLRREALLLRLELRRLLRLELCLEERIRLICSASHGVKRVV